MGKGVRKEEIYSKSTSFAMAPYIDPGARGTGYIIPYIYGIYTAVRHRDPLPGSRSKSRSKSRSRVSGHPGHWSWSLGHPGRLPPPILSHPWSLVLVSGHWSPWSRVLSLRPATTQTMVLGLGSLVTGLGLGSGLHGLGSRSWSRSRSRSRTQVQVQVSDPDSPFMRLDP